MERRVPSGLELLSSIPTDYKDKRPNTVTIAFFLVIYVLIFLPIVLILRSFKVEFLKLRFDAAAKSYFNPVENEANLCHAPTRVLRPQQDQNS